MVAHIYLFYGDDSLASSLALKKWQQLYQDKHGVTNQFLIEGGEGDLNRFKEKLTEALTVQTLFSEPSITIIRRPTVQDRSPKGEFALTLVKLLDKLEISKDPTQTVLIWEDRLLAHNSILLEWFNTHTENGWAKTLLHNFNSPPVVLARLSKQLQAEGWTLTNDGAAYLQQCLLDWLKQQRLQERLKYNQELERDWRGYYLSQTIETAKLLAERAEINRAVLMTATGESYGLISVFEISDAMTRRHWSKAKQLLQTWEKEKVDDSNYFGLLAILRQKWGLERDGLFSNLGLQYLADIDLMAKNGIWSLPWLVERLVTCLEETSKGAEKIEFVSGKKLWLSTLPRS